MEFIKSIPPWVILLLGITAAIAGIFSDHIWLTIIACIVNIIVLTVQYFQNKKYVYDFTENDWLDNDGDGYMLVIPNRLHHKGKQSQASVFMINPDKSYSEVGIEFKSNARGEVIIGANSKFQGQIRIH